jgi:DNA (cytosine-5)-methyltransferase 1
MSEKLTHFSLFSGIGGIGLASEWAGFTTVGQCEIDDYCTKVLEKHWPGVPRWRDIRDVTAESVRAAGIGAITLVSGGFPCQPFSIAGQRRGAADDRHLWPEMLRVISQLRPPWVIGENVAGITSMVLESLPTKVESRALARNPDHDLYEAVLSRQEIMLLDRVCQDLEAENYEVQPLLIPACAVNANHKRERVFIVADSSSQRLQERQEPGEMEEWGAPTGIKRHGGRQNFGRYSGAQWAVEPDVGRVANGVPSRVDRLRALGNAVVPAQVYPILQAIADADIERGEGNLLEIVALEIVARDK